MDGEQFQYENVYALGEDIILLRHLSYEYK